MGGTGTPAGATSPADGVAKAAAGRAGPGVVPSNASAGAAYTAQPAISIDAICLDIRIALFLLRPAGMGHRATDGRSNLLGVLPQNPGPEARRRRLPGLLAFGEFGGRQLD